MRNKNLVNPKVLWIWKRGFTIYDVNDFFNNFRFLICDENAFHFLREFLVQCLIRIQTFDYQECKNMFNLVFLPTLNLLVGNVWIQPCLIFVRFLLVYIYIQKYLLLLRFQRKTKFVWWKQGRNLIVIFYLFYPAIKENGGWDFYIDVLSSYMYITIMMY